MFLNVTSTLWIQMHSWTCGSVSGGENKSQFRCKCLGSKEKVTTKCSRGGGLISLKVFIGFVVLFEAVWINWRQREGQNVVRIALKTPYFHFQRLQSGLNTPHLSLVLSAAQNCSGLRTCSDCLERAECGWCGDPSNTGKGVCMEGSYRGPLKPAGARTGPRDRDRLRDRDMVLDQSLCTSDRGYNWAFIQCPGEQNHQNRPHPRRFYCLHSSQDWKWKCASSLFITSDLLQ